MSHSPTAPADDEAELRSLQLMRASLAQLERTTADLLGSLQAHQGSYTAFADESGRLQAALGLGEADTAPDKD